MDRTENLAAVEQMAPLNEARVIFLGDSDAGKTYLIERMLNGGQEPDAFLGLPTPEIGIRDMVCHMGGRQVKLHIWDFGGQEILHSLHRIFMTRQAFYVVVLNARTDPRGERARYWLDTVDCFAPGAPVMLVLNRIDKNVNASVSETDLRKRCPNLTRVVRQHALAGSRERFNDSFVNVLLEEIRKADLTGVPMPASWLRVRQRLLSQTEPWITGRQFRDICDDCRVGDNWRELLRRFHDLGISLYFGQDDGRKHLVVLNPAWITCAMSRILLIGNLDTGGGRVSRDFIQQLLGRTDMGFSCLGYSAGDVQCVLDIMRQCRMSFRMDEEHEFIPMACPREASVDIPYYQQESEVVEFHMEFRHLSTDLLHRLMVERKHELDIENTWRTGARFHQPEAGISAVVAIDGNVLLTFLRSENPGTPGTQINEYLNKLKTHTEHIADEMGLEAPACRIIYKQDGMREPFDYEMLTAMLEHGEQNIYSRSRRRMISIADVLRRSMPEDWTAERHLVDAIRTACQHMQKNTAFYGYQNEELRIRYIRDTLQMQGYDAWDQMVGARGGMDLVITDGRREPIAGAEVANISLGGSWIRKWDDHLSHFIDQNAMGLPTLYLICFVGCGKNRYAEVWERFSEHMRQFSPDRARLLPGSYEEIGGSDYEAQFLRIVRCRYYINGKVVTLYHYFVRVDADQAAADTEEGTGGPGEEQGWFAPAGDLTETEPEEQLPEEDAEQAEEILLPEPLPPEQEEPVSENPLEEVVLKPGPFRPVRPVTPAPAQDGGMIEWSEREPVLNRLWNRILEALRKLFPPAQAEQKAGSAQVLKECRVVFLGDSEAGKTLIMSRVENPKMDPARFHGNTTLGINIFSRVENIAGQKVRVNYWDFGGQEILHSMHRMFLSEKTIYVIVLNTRNDNQDAQADFWLRYVEAYAPGAPVMLVMNKIDQNKRAELNRAVLRRHFPQKKLDDNNVLKISAVERNPKVFLDEFKEKLLAFIDQNAFCIHRFEPLEARIRDEVEMKKEKVFGTDDFMEICKDKGVGGTQAQYDLMNRFNDAGIMVFLARKPPCS